MKRTIFLIVVVAIIAGGGWWWWTKTPQYAVQQAADAVKKHDVDRFHQWVDVDSVSSNAVDDLLAEPVRSSGAGILERVVGFTLVSLFKPTVVESMDKQIDHWVKHRQQPQTDSSSSRADSASDSSDADEEDEPKSLVGAVVGAFVKPPSLKLFFKDMGFTKKNYRGLGSTDQSDHLAHVGLKFYSPKVKRDVQVKLELNNEDGHWEITRISNLQDLVTTIAAR